MDAIIVACHDDIGAVVVIMVVVVVVATSVNSRRECVDLVH